jgi:predicted nucleic acid-binding protein
VCACVLDASFTFQWLFADEASPEGYAALSMITRDGAVVPALWFVEITNVLGLAERRGRVSAAGVENALGLLRALPLMVDTQPSFAWSEPVLALMRTHRLTAYDATYLELAMWRGLPLATKDRDLLAAAPAVGVPLFAPSP